MDRVRACDLGRADDRRHVQVALGAARGADAHVLVGKEHVQRVLVGFRVHRHRLDAELPARVDHPQRDFPAVGDQDLLEHLTPATTTRAHGTGALNGLCVSAPLWPVSAILASSYAGLMANSRSPY